MRKPQKIFEYKVLIFIRVRVSAIYEIVLSFSTEYLGNSNTLNFNPKLVTHTHNTSLFAKLNTKY